MSTRSPAISIKLLYALTAGLSALLLFSVEPMAARRLLPLLGGSSAVWISALAFFQITLLLGYGYTVLLTRASSRSHTPLLAHLALLGLAILFLLLPHADVLSAGTTGNPQLLLFLSLGSTIGVPFLVLSTTAPLLQAWYARRERAAVPYRLFALSNFSSLFALLAYPLVVEPHLTLGRQESLWRAGFLLYAGLITALAFRMRSAAPPQDAAPSASADVSAPVASARSAPTAPTICASRPLLLWFFLPAVASAQLAAVTAHLTQDVAAMPLLWVLPLAAYLLSFVLAFEFHTFYRRGIVLRVLAVLLFSLGSFLAQTGVNIPIALSILFFVTELLVATWFLHAEVFVLRPRESSASTIFYFLLAAGGATGTIAVAVLSPLLSQSNFDLPLSFLLTAAAVVVVTWRAGVGHRLFWATATALGFVVLVTLHNQYEHDALLRARNFYGSIRVTQTYLPPQAQTSRVLFNGSIQHGMQWFSQDFHDTPLTYYAPDTGVGIALEHCCAGRPRRIGVIGLGAGTLAAYGRAGDSIGFYEINPLVITVASHLFTYTRQTPAAVDVVPGDARLSLAAEPPQHFDVLVVDAFSGDSIPVHLLTREALDLYRRHLAPGGIIAFHISNRYLDLAPVVARLVESTQSSGTPLFAREIETQANEDRGELRAFWVLVTDYPALFNDPAFAGSEPIQTRPTVGLWTDQYSTLLPIVRWSGRDRPH